MTNARTMEVLEILTILAKYLSTSTSTHKIVLKYLNPTLITLLLVLKVNQVRTWSLTRLIWLDSFSNGLVNLVK